jgi:hypothetical protein
MQMRMIRNCGFYVLTLRHFAGAPAVITTWLWLAAVVGRLLRCARKDRNKLAMTEEKLAKTIYRLREGAG